MIGVILLTKCKKKHDGIEDEAEDANKDKKSEKEKEAKKKRGNTLNNKKAGRTAAAHLPATQATCLPLCMGGIFQKTGL